MHNFHFEVELTHPIFRFYPTNKTIDPPCLYIGWVKFNKEGGDIMKAKKAKKAKKGKKGCK